MFITWLSHREVEGTLVGFRERGCQMEKQHFESVFGAFVSVKLQDIFDVGPQRFNICKIWLHWISLRRTMDKIWPCWWRQIWVFWVDHGTFPAVFVKNKWISFVWSWVISICVCGDQIWIFFMGSWDIPSRVFADKTECLWGDLRTSAGLFVETKYRCFFNGKLNRLQPCLWTPKQVF